MPQPFKQQSASRISGTISKFITDKGFGFIVGEDQQEYFFHRTALRGVAESDIGAGMAVSFIPSKGPKGSRAEDVQFV